MSNQMKARTLKTMNNISMNNKTKKNNNKSKRARYMKLVKTVRPIRNILKNHRQGKITNKQRNNQLNNRVEFNKTRRIHWYSQAEREAMKKNHKAENDLLEFFQNRENIEEKKAQQRVRDFNAKLQKFVKNTERKRKGKANKGGKRKTRRRRKKKKRKAKRR